jgi:hypothetical protein
MTPQGKAVEGHGPLSGHVPDPTAEGTWDWINSRTS